MCPLFRSFNGCLRCVLQADLAFKQEEKEKSEATAISLDSGEGSYSSLHPLSLPPFLLPVNYECKIAFMFVLYNLQRIRSYSRTW